MYRYDDYDKQILNERVEQFRGQMKRYLAGELDDKDFRALRLMNGLYIQRFAPMLRVAIPYGMLSSTQMRKLADIARKYDRGYGHFSTRQNIQYNWPKLESIPDILAELAEVEMHSVQTSGNCIRNTTTDQLAGVAVDELEDPRPWCELIRQWSSFHPEFAYLPRKFKIAVTATKQDRAAMRMHDVGLRLLKNDQGQTGFEVWVGGGLGRTPILSTKINDFVEWPHLFSYLEAILRTYNRLGIRENTNKARIKILVRDMGGEAFAELVETEWQKIRASEDYLTITDADLNTMKAHFTRPDYDSKTAGQSDLQSQLESNAEFARWVQHNVAEHQQPGYKAVYISLKAPGIPPGDCTHEQMDLIADLADEYSFAELRTTHDQNLVLADVREADLFALWQKLSAQDLATANIGTLNDMICCPGLDFCGLANAGSIGIAEKINQRFDDLDYLYDLGEIKLKMSGCMNGCGHHSVGHIGILGVDKKGVEWYQLTLGGDASNDAALGDRLGPSFDKDHVVDAVEDILKVYLEHREGEERLVDTYRRIGMEPFKERVYATREAA
ncbi:MAG: nitrite/sulfite reductase [Nevskiales bacterium]